MHRGKTSYLPDFRVDHTDGSHEWHETKGFMTAGARQQLRHMRKYYPDENIIMIVRQRPDYKLTDFCRKTDIGLAHVPL